MKNTRRNIIISYISTIITMAFQFVSRTVIIKELGDAYLGIGSLFTSILTVLSVGELGFSGAITYNLYKPLAEGNTIQVCALLNYYRKIYRNVGTVILIGGLLVIPFLKGLIRDNIPEDMNLYLLYVLYLLNTVISYFLFAYKISLLEALQRTDIIKYAYTIAIMIQYTLQIISIIVWKNYYLYLFVMILGTVTNNIIAACIAKRRFPQYACKGDINRETKIDITSRVKGLLISRISDVTYTTFDSIILSTTIGLSAVAVYNNYLIVFNAVTSIIVLIRISMQASIGNSIATESIEKNYQDMLLWQFLFSVIATWCVTCLVSLYQPFMSLWMGTERLLTMIDVVLICLCLFNTVLSHSYYLYLSGNGLWWEMRWPYILSAISNIILNIILGKLFGITGIVFSTWFVGLIFGSVWQCRIILKEYFGKGIGTFVKRYFRYFLVTSCSAGVSYRINQFIPDVGIWGLIIKTIICTVISGIIVLLCYKKTEVFKRAIDFFKYAWS